MKLIAGLTFLYHMPSNNIFDYQYACLCVRVCVCVCVFPLSSSKFPTFTHKIHTQTPLNIFSVCCSNCQPKIF